MENVEEASSEHPIMSNSFSEEYANMSASEVATILNNATDHYQDNKGTTIGFYHECFENGSMLVPASMFPPPPQVVNNTTIAEEESVHGNLTLTMASQVSLYFSYISRVYLTTMIHN